ncbi:MAG: 4-(cytidine 5'-diphospho)-2-C-methyl-D-erythritol kinase [Phycisphaerales bacterium]|nr:4-(cytidine 5'-diphospho)-2-C-methyl-D-erythritol kinase [Phycisphaerales bacterium]
MTTMAPQLIRCRAPAKVNLTLAVLGSRSDGFHEIESWVLPINWCDQLSLSASDQLSLRVEGASKGVPEDASNLVRRATTALAQAADREPAVAIVLEKSIPAEAGLGGGSSDAASTLMGLNRLWELNWPIERLVPIAAEIGSDVPLFLNPGSVIIRGRGERVERLERGWNGRLVVVVPPYSVSTKAVYEAWEAGARSESLHSSPWDEPTLEGESLMARLYNDLEPAAFAVEPRLRKVHSALEEIGGRPVRMTGSGSAFFTIFDRQEPAEAWRADVQSFLSSDFQVRVFSAG